jgi:hypothetical protein
MQVVLDGHPVEELPPLRHVDQAEVEDLLRRQAPEVVPVESQPPLRWQDARRGAPCAPQRAAGAPSERT